MEDQKYSLGADIKAQDVYDRHTSKRQSVVDTARLMAELTIPSVFPPEGYEGGDDLPGNNQSVGAQCVNTLGSHLMFMAFPPGQPIMNLEPKEEEFREEIAQDPELWGKTKLALSRLEMTHRLALASTSLSTAYVGYVKLLLVAGNALWKHLRLGSPTYFKPDSYIVVRNKMGTPLLSIHKETVNLMGMDKDHVDFIKERMDPEEWDKMPEWERTVDTYSVCKVSTDDKGDMTWCYWEEWEGLLLPDTGVETDYDKPPQWPGWLIPVYGSNWGRSYCEEYRGDLYSVEALASSGNDLAALAALGLLFVKPGSSTSIRQIREAKNLSTLPGDAADLTVFRSEKGADANQVASREELVARRLASAFLLQSSVQRTGERVTAEEVSRLGNELDKAMGGLYTSTGQGNQKIVIVRAVALNEAENPNIPSLPEGMVDIRITTGVDAMGQSNDANALTDFAKTIKELFPMTGEELIDGTDFARRYAAAKGIKPDGLVRSPEVVAANQQKRQQDAMVQEAASKATGPAVKGLMDQMQPPEGA